MEIQMFTSAVKKTLKKHKEQHEQDFVNQMNGWKAAMDSHSEKMKEWANDGGVSKNRPQEPPKPVSYTKDYDRLIEMVNCHEDQYITLDDEDFKNIVKDEFGWKGHFLSNTAMYSGGIVQ